MNKREMFKEFAIAAIMLVIGIIIVLVSGGFVGLVSSVGTALATLGISHALHTGSCMRENCLYGSSRGRAYPTGASRFTLHPIVFMIP